MELTYHSFKHRKDSDKKLRKSWFINIQTLYLWGCQRHVGYEIRYLYLFVSNYHISSGSLLSDPCEPSSPSSHWMSTTHAQVYSLRKFDFLQLKDCQRDTTHLASRRQLSQAVKNLWRGHICHCDSVGEPDSLPCEGDTLYCTALDSLTVSFSLQRPHQEISGHWPSQTAGQHEGELVRLPGSLNHMAAHHISYLQ